MKVARIYYKSLQSDHINIFESLPSEFVGFKGDGIGIGFWNFNTGEGQSSTEYKEDKFYRTVKWGIDIGELIILRDRK